MRSVISLLCSHGHAVAQPRGAHLTLDRFRTQQSRRSGRSDVLGQGVLAPESRFSAANSRQLPAIARHRAHRRHGSRVSETRASAIDHPVRMMSCAARRRTLRVRVRAEANFGRGCRVLWVALDGLPAPEPLDHSLCADVVAAHGGADPFAACNLRQPTHGAERRPPDAAAAGITRYDDRRLDRRLVSFQIERCYGYSRADRDI
jgi:hypothetical protein